MRTILLATSNPGKLREIQSAMGDLPVRWITLKGLSAAIPQAEETGDTFAANAIEKAVYYSRAAGLRTLADDSGLQVDALGGAPGVRSARYAGLDSDVVGREQADAANNARLLAELANVPDEKRTARFRCALALVDGERVLVETSGVVEGRMLRAPRGTNGFGYDPLFFIPAMGCTTAELTQEQKNQISHRGQAVRALHPLLAKLLGA
ncbi:MAG: RdgB/HAM1 family non-canonical purine NTP pyrophosphatase [Phycisphaerae bacterium]|nr:RdgB/HAM1 family non-canonical purine NTP pyrophosphatase [Phycisphaerae bacterium]